MSDIFLTNNFSDGFENAASVTDLLRQDLTRWHGTQLEPESSTIELIGSPVSEGVQALKCTVPYNGGSVCKADIFREGLRFKRGNKLIFQAKFFLVGGTDMQEVWLADFEDSTLPYSWGRRIYIQNGEELASDGKWEPRPVTFRGTLVVPKDRWFTLRAVLKLYENRNGVMDVYQDGKLSFHGRGPTLPTATAAYDRIQVGITSSKFHPQTLYVDDVQIAQG